MRKIFIIFALILKVASCFCQNLSAENETWQQKFFRSEEVTLPILIDAAIKNSVQLERLANSKEAAGEDLKVTKKQILSGISVGTGYSFGTRLGVIGSSDVPANSFNAFALPARSTYNVGLNMGLSLLQVIGRKHNIRKSEIAIKQVELDQKLQERQIREATINLYKELILARTVMLHSQDALQSAKVNKGIADKRFKEGELEVDEQIASIGYYNQAVLGYEQAKNRYETTVLIIEELIGMSLKDLMTSK